MRGARARWIGRALIVIGLLAIGWAALGALTTAWYQRQYRTTLETLRVSQDTEAPAGPVSLPTGEPIGTLEIARIGLSGVVVEGDDERVLRRAIGHLPDTPLPWRRGNSALAAHRDTLFRPLRHVRLGDVLRLTTPHGAFDYRVRETLIVRPDELWVLDETSGSMLTLISCFPFHYIGHAPERFIVRAERIDDPRSPFGHSEYD